MSDAPRTAAQAAGESVEQKIARLERELAAANCRVELLEHDMKSGDYETLYAQMVDELAAARASERERLAKIADEHPDTLESVGEAGSGKFKAVSKLAKIFRALDAPEQNTDGGGGAGGNGTAAQTIIGPVPASPPRPGLCIGNRSPDDCDEAPDRREGQRRADYKNRELLQRIFVTRTGILTRTGPDRRKP